MKVVRNVIGCTIVAASFLLPGIAIADAVDKAVGVGAAAVTNENLKTKAKEKKKNGEKLTPAERHRYTTSLGVGLAANQASHEARDKKKKKKGN